MNWELANGALYIIGGITFVVGSVFFLPQYEEFLDIG
ncbi:MAG: YrhK family protein, partial [Halothece sp. Uz-M2-17]|nr:YrhK family protein [Halothece sp. Uz-M2-17]